VCGTFRSERSDFTENVFHFQGLADATIVNASPWNKRSGDADLGCVLEFLKLRQLDLHLRDRALGFTAFAALMDPFVHLPEKIDGQA